jgi:hypothetical protein
VTNNAAEPVFKEDSSFIIAFLRLATSSEAFETSGPRPLIQPAKAIEHNLGCSVGHEQILRKCKWLWLDGRIAVAGRAYEFRIHSEFMAPTAPRRCSKAR